MKTRREFFKTLAGSMAVVAACVYAPKSLMTESNKETILSTRAWIEKLDKGIHQIYLNTKRNPKGT